ncbi:4a-hydroxytetrahydrobiopterin dehydratase [Streptosporangium sp. NPDC049644]|uniref:4a-hydroxytetrahydrobiopterin dehydratase n=1 Tax=Streptosporangium sp. NPDC049644 TaxID=3155507 RepID=UPI00342B3C22
MHGKELQARSLQGREADITWQRIRFVITTHDAGNRLTAKDFELARHIDVIAAGHGAETV